MTMQEARDLLIAPARVLEGKNPFGVDPRTDLLSTPRHDVPLWSETMLFTVWSPEQQVGVWLHVGMVVEDKTMWWAQTFALLPDGVVLADRSFGRTTERAEVSTGNARVRCVEPQKRWKLMFDGAGELTSSAALAENLVGAGIAKPFSFEIDVDAVTPVYDLHAALPGLHVSAPTTESGEIDWGMGGIHHEQSFRATGTLRALGRSWEIDGVAVRDHSVGERDYANFGGHVWNHAVWPDSGRSVGVFTMWRRDEPRVSACAAMVYEDGRTEICPDFTITGAERHGGYPREMTLSLVRADGSRLDLGGEVVHNVTVTYGDPNENLNGAATDPSFQTGDPLIADESIVRWHWPDGDVGYGNVERGFRRSILPRTQIPLPPNSIFSTGR